MTAPPDQPPTGQTPPDAPRETYPATGPAAGGHRSPTGREHRSRPTVGQPPGTLGLPDRIQFWLRWLGFCSLLVVLFAFAAHAVEPASGPSWLFLGLQLAAFVGVVAIGVPLLLDGTARIRANRREQPRDTPSLDDTPQTPGELGEGRGDGRR